MVVFIQHQPTAQPKHFWARQTIQRLLGRAPAYVGAFSGGRAAASIRV